MKAIVKVIQSGSMGSVIMAVMDFWSGGGGLLWTFINLMSTERNLVG